MCWPIVDVKLADAPPPKPKVAGKKAEFVLVSDQLHLIPGPPTADPAQQAYYASAPVPEPVKHNFWYGKTRAEVEAEKPKPAPVLQQVSTPPQQQFYCREIDGTYTLRSTTEIMQKLQPGFWTHSDIGYPYWVRTKP